MQVIVRVLAFVLVLTASIPAHALDGPFTWEEVLCRIDAIAEIEEILATKTTPDRVEVRRVIWNRTKHRIRPTRGDTIIRNLSKRRWELQSHVAWWRRNGSNADPSKTLVLSRRALQRGSYRTIVFLSWIPQDGDWSGGGAVYINRVQWLDHPDHAEWWAMIQPYLRQLEEASNRHEKPAFCANIKGDPSDFEVTAFKKWFHF
jgi:hypothetical protein